MWPAWMSTSTFLRGGAPVMPMTVTCCRSKSGDWAGASLVVSRNARARTSLTKSIGLRRTEICSQSVGGLSATRNLQRFLCAISELPVIREQLREAPMSQLFAALNDAREELVL